MAKPFSVKEYDESDDVGKSILVDFLKSKKWTSFNFNEQEAICSGICENWDVECASPSKEIVYRFDAEVRKIWEYGSNKFPYSTIHVPARKMKNSYNSVDFFASISKDLKGIVLINRRLVMDSKVVKSSVNNWDRRGRIIMADYFFFIRKNESLSGVGSIERPFVIEFGEIGDQQFHVLCDGITAMYSAMGIEEVPICKEINNLFLRVVSIYKTVSALYGKAVFNIDDCFDNLYFAMENIIGLNSPEIKIELIKPFRLVWERFENDRYYNLVYATKDISEFVLKITNEKTINGFLNLTGIMVSGECATISAIAGFPIDPIYIV